MSNQNHYLKIKQLVDNLESNCPGTADEIARKLNISRRSFFRYLGDLRAHGASIEYCNSRKAYSLKNRFDFFRTYF